MRAGNNNHSRKKLTRGKKPEMAEPSKEEAKREILLRDVHASRGQVVDKSYGKGNGINAIDFES